MTVKNEAATAAGGKTKQAQPETTANTTTTKAVIVKELPKPAEPPQVEDLEHRLHRLNQLFSLQAKYQRLCTSELKLAEFNASADKEDTTIVISDNNRNRFETSNPEVVAQVLDFMKTITKERKKLLEPQLKW